MRGNIEVKVLITIIISSYLGEREKKYGVLLIDTGLG